MNKRNKVPIYVSQVDSHLRFRCLRMRNLRRFLNSLHSHNTLEWRNAFIKPNLYYGHSSALGRWSIFIKNIKDKSRTKKIKKLEDIKHINEKLQVYKVRI